MFCTLCANVLQSGCKTALPRILTTCLTFSAINSVGSSSSLTPWWYLQLPYDTWARNIIQSFNRVITWGRHASGSPQSQQPPPVLFAYQSCPVWSLFLKHSSQIAQLSSICSRINTSKCDDITYRTLATMIGQITVFVHFSTNAWFALAVQGCKCFLGISSGTPILALIIRRIYVMYS